MINRVLPMGAALVCVGMIWCGRVWAQATSGAADDALVSVVRGKVVNAVTGVPVGRALVVAAGNEAAVFTDDRGEFALKISDSKAGVAADRMARRQLEVRRPGFLTLSRSIPYSRGSTEGDAAEATLALVPEALVVGRVEVPGSNGEVQIECQLYEKQFQYGQESWAPSKTFHTWTNGEFRFSDLPAGTYKLITHEQMDRDSMRPLPGAPMFGYPPIYYPNTTDFSAASPIVVKAGETAQVNLTVARREYYPVQIGVRNAPPGQAMNLQLAPMNTHSPGWSLGYNRIDGAIEGMLPDGNYTLQATTMGQEQSTGILNFAVRGKPLEGPAMTLVPNPSITVNVHQEFSGHSDAGARGAIATSTTGPAMEVQVYLISVKEVGVGAHLFSRPMEGTDANTSMIPNVVPGQYRARVTAGQGYVASMESGGVDLLRLPLVLGLGGSPAPIEIVLRDDGGEVDLSWEQGPATAGDSVQGAANSKTGIAYLLSLDTTDEEPKMKASAQGNVTFDQLAPGDYLAVVFDAPVELPPTASVFEASKSKGKVIHVEAGQKVSVQVKLNSENEE